MVATGQQRLTGWRAEGRGVKAVDLCFQSARRELLRVRCLTRAAKGARRTKPRVVDENEQNVRRTLWRAQLLDGREFRVRILGVVRNQATPGCVRHRKVRPVLFAFVAHVICSRATVPPAYFSMLERSFIVGAPESLLIDTDQSSGNNRESRPGGRPTMSSESTSPGLRFSTSPAAPAIGRSAALVRPRRLGPVLHRSGFASISNTGSAHDPCSRVFFTEVEQAIQRNIHSKRSCFLSVPRTRGLRR